MTLNISPPPARNREDIPTTAYEQKKITVIGVAISPWEIRYPVKRAGQYAGKATYAFVPTDMQHYTLESIERPGDCADSVLLEDLAVKYPRWTFEAS